MIHTSGVSIPDEPIYMSRACPVWCVPMVWISVEERLPEDSGNYWVYQPTCPPQSHPMNVIRFVGEWLTSWEVTHWMPLPDPPKGKKCQK